MSAGNLYSLWLRQLRAKQAADVLKSQEAFDMLGNKTSPYGRSIAAILELRKQALAIYDAAPSDLPDHPTAALAAPSDVATMAGLESSVGHLSALVDNLRDLLGTAMRAMKAIEDVATPENESGGDFDASIPYEAWAKFVDARARLLYEIKHSPHDGSVKTSALAAGEEKKL